MALAFVGLGLGCGVRPVATGSGGAGLVGTGGRGIGGDRDAGADGGVTATGGASSGSGGGSAGSGGGSTGTGGQVSTDGPIDCSNVGCGEPPLCSAGCREACGCCPCPAGQRFGNLVCMDGCYVPIQNDASVDGTADATVDASALCESLRAEYTAALRATQECTPGAAHQCEQQVRASFFCNCNTFTNSGADILAAIVARYQEGGCPIVCAGICVPQTPLACAADTTSAAGGRCKRPGVLELRAADNGGTFIVSVGDELDITLESMVPGSYDTAVTLSSHDIATVLEITILAGPPNLNGPTRLYRLRALSAGQLQVQIPFEPTASSTPRPTYAVTITAR